eukprot:CAMPEP_0184651710 /NCGR_PEP_ID=MMETSP0308-20130426/9363_1 /TAXON_ID=38269 /ORGANISM="Gloeochaete witrockiana, Strain SAG 46.84" /LENGTH=661 /DNA_ID=CAMNT_0027086129 /DNA_START=180 /DNA_END=2165 /DNA_ORIENTATION=+
MRLMQGENCVSALSSEKKEAILDKNVVQMVKDPKTGERRKKVVSEAKEVIQLASFIGELNLTKEYGIPERIVEVLDTAYQLAIAAGLEAIWNAGIELDTKSNGKSGASDNVRYGPLPKEMQDTTGVIFASSFPALDSMIEEVSRYLDNRLARLPRRELASRLQKYASDSVLLHTNGIKQAREDLIAECKAVFGEYLDVGAAAGGEPYHFSRKLLFQILVMANAQLAELIHARGPNTHMNAACASTAQAIATAEDWIRVGRCERVIVISGDNATSDNLLPFIGTGFLALGAASTAPSVDSAAKPFDKSRNGMVLGAGSVALVIETETAALKRGRRPLCRILGTHIANSAFHAALLDSKHISTELSVFLSKIERRRGVKRSNISSSCIYMSHETFTCAHGGCAKVEVDALRSAFGAEDLPNIIIANTKGFTAHPMGVGIEDAMAAACLDLGLVPPMANFREADPCLGTNLNISKGGPHSAQYVLRFAAGFGSHFVYVLYGAYDDESAPEEDHQHNSVGETAEAESLSADPSTTTATASSVAVEASTCSVGTLTPPTTSINPTLPVPTSELTSAHPPSTVPLEDEATQTDLDSKPHHHTHPHHHHHGKVHPHALPPPRSVRAPRKPHGLPTPLLERNIELLRRLERRDSSGFSSDASNASGPGS